MLATSHVWAASTTWSLLSCGMVGDGRKYLVRRKAIGVRLAGAVGVDRCGEVELRAIIQLEGLHGGGFAGRLGSEEAGDGPAMESDGDGFC